MPPSVLVVDLVRRVQQDMTAQGPIVDAMSNPVGHFGMSRPEISFGMSRAHALRQAAQSSSRAAKGADLCMRVRVRVHRYPWSKEEARTDNSTGTPITLTFTNGCVHSSGSHTGLSAGSVPGRAEWTNRAFTWARACAHRAWRTDHLGGMNVRTRHILGHTRRER